jgi:thiol-disulfide isomerase/thioredoxin
MLSSELKGKVLFINFWASWCSPCKEEMPSIDKLFRHFSTHQDFIMLPVIYRDSPQDAANYLKESGFNLPIVIDKDGKAARSYGVRGVPETYIIDKKGIIRKKVIGPYEWNSPDVLAFITELLKE